MWKKFKRSFGKGKPRCCSNIADSIRRGHHKCVIKQLQDGPATLAMAKAPDGSTPLHQAAIEGQIVCAHTLLEFGAYPNAQDAWQQTPLHWAATYGHSRLAALLVSRGADVLLQAKSGYSALHLAAKYGHADVIQLLLTHGARVDTVDRHGNTPIHSAAKYGHVDVVHLLLHHDAGRHITQPGQDGLDAIALAREHEGAEAAVMMQAFLDTGEIPELVIEPGEGSDGEGRASAASSPMRRASADAGAMNSPASPSPTLAVRAALTPPRSNPTALSQDQAPETPLMLGGRRPSRRSSTGSSTSADHNLVVQAPTPSKPVAAPSLITVASSNGNGLPQGSLSRPPRSPLPATFTNPYPGMPRRAATEPRRRASKPSRSLTSVMSGWDAQAATASDDPAAACNVYHDEDEARSWEQARRAYDQLLAEQRSGRVEQRRATDLFLHQLRLPSTPGGSVKARPAPDRRPVAIVPKSPAGKFGSISRRASHQRNTSTGNELVLDDLLQAVADENHTGTVGISTSSSPRTTTNLLTSDANASLRSLPPIGSSSSCNASPLPPTGDVARAGGASAASTPASAGSQAARGTAVVASDDVALEVMQASPPGEAGVATQHASAGHAASMRSARTGPGTGHSADVTEHLLHAAMRHVDVLEHRLRSEASVATAGAARSDEVAVAQARAHAAERAVDEWERRCIHLARHMAALGVGEEADGADAVAGSNSGSTGAVMVEALEAQVLRNFRSLASLSSELESTQQQLLDALEMLKTSRSEVYKLRTLLHQVQTLGAGDDAVDSTTEANRLQETLEQLQASRAEANKLRTLLQQLKSSLSEEREGKTAANRLLDDVAGQLGKILDQHDVDMASSRPAQEASEIASVSMATAGSGDAQLTPRADERRHALEKQLEDVRRHLAETHRRNQQLVAHLRRVDDCCADEGDKRG